MRFGEYQHIAVVAAGMDEEYQESVLRGIFDAAKAHNCNVACFAAFGGVLGSSRYDTGEYNIYSLAQFDRFDAAVLLTNTINSAELRSNIMHRAKQAGIPVAVLDSDEEPAFYNVKIDNTAAMRKMVQHVIEVHGAKTINYISGPLANPEAKARYEAFLDVMTEHDLTADARRIYFGEFRPIDGKQAVEALLASGMKLPDAIISANDAMALDAMEALNQHGIRVPEDVIVTGFDHTYYARHHSPILTTVMRPLYYAGYCACEKVLNLIGEDDGIRETELQARPVFSESCGCVPEDLSDIRSYKESTYKTIKCMRADISLLNRMTSALAETETAEENFRVISTYLHELGCSEACICLCDDWQNIYQDTAAEYLVNGYTKLMSAPLIWRENEVSSVSSFQSADMYPVKPKTGGNISFFLPLHFRERCLGYYIITNGDFPIRSMLCHSLMMNISHSLEQVRKLLNLNSAIKELDRLYVIDPLCNIYNRNGFIRLADKMFKECVAAGSTILVAFIDMDGLKLINDNYGHDEGDFALRRLADVIHNTCGEGQICARFGGDEFIILGTGADLQDGAELERIFAKNLAEMNRIIGKPYMLSSSIGTFVTAVTPDMKLFSLISKADQIMYEQKKRKRTSRYLRKN